MRNTRLFLGLLLVVVCARLSSAAAAELTLARPLDFQVVQRSTNEKGTIPIAGRLLNVDGDSVVVEARIVAEGNEGRNEGAWQALATSSEWPTFQAVLDAPAGGWYRLDVRARKGESTLAETKVEHVGVGEVFVVAGQSNSANHGEERQSTKTGRVATLAGERWQLANDPQPGASGGGGSFMPPFGDAIVERFHVPVGFVACGIGATSVREWLPAGTKFPNPPTLVGLVHKLPSGEWESKGWAFEPFVNKMKSLGPRGFRAVLWHQGESDANQQDATRTLPGKLYREYLELVIRQSRREIGWEAPWCVAQVSYHVPGDEASPDIREAQASLWRDGIAWEGPDSDALKREWREANGNGVHFSGNGLRELAGRWAKKVAPHLEPSDPAATSGR